MSAFLSLYYRNKLKINYASEQHRKEETHAAPYYEQMPNCVRIFHAPPQIKYHPQRIRQPTRQYKPHPARWYVIYHRRQYEQQCPPHKQIQPDHPFRLLLWITNFHNRAEYHNRPQDSKNGPPQSPAQIHQQKRRVCSRNQRIYCDTVPYLKKTFRFLAYCRMTHC